MPALATFQNVEELSPTLLSDSPVQAPLVLALANHVADQQRFHRDEVGALHNLVGEAMEFLPSRLRLPFLCPLKRRLLLAAALRTSPAARHRALLPADCTSHRRLPLALHMSAVGKGGKAPDARIQPHRAFRRVRPDYRQILFEQELNLDPPRLAHNAEAPKPVQRRQGAPDHEAHAWAGYVLHRTEALLPESLGCGLRDRALAMWREHTPNGTIYWRKLEKTIIWQ